MVKTDDLFRLQERDSEQNDLFYQSAGPDLDAAVAWIFPAAHLWENTLSFTEAALGRNMNAHVHIEHGLQINISTETCIDNAHLTSLLPMFELQGAKEESSRDRKTRH